MKKPSIRKITGLLLLLLLTVVMITGCSSNEQAVVEIEHNVSVAEASALIDEGIFLLDVRTQEEWNEAHIKNSNVIPVERLENFLDQVPKDEPVLVYCNSGNRSADALDILLDNGYTEVYNMLGGISTWYESGYPVDFGQ